MTKIWHAKICQVGGKQTSDTITAVNEILKFLQHGQYDNKFKPRIHTLPGCVQCTVNDMLDI